MLFFWDWAPREAATLGRPCHSCPANIIRGRPRVAASGQASRLGLWNQSESERIQNKLPSQQWRRTSRCAKRPPQEPPSPPRSQEPGHAALGPAPPCRYYITVLFLSPRIPYSVNLDFELANGLERVPLDGSGSKGSRPALHAATAWNPATTDPPQPAINRPPRLSSVQSRSCIQIAPPFVPQEADSLTIRTAPWISICSFLQFYATHVQY